MHLRNIHVIATENQHLEQNQVVHLFDVWDTTDPTLGTGRTFLMRRAARLSRDLQVMQILEWVGVLHAGLYEQVFASVRNHEAQEQAVFSGRQRLLVPDSSLVDLILVRQQMGCADNSDIHSQGTILAIKDGLTVQEHTQVKHRDNTATLDEREDDINGLMQDPPRDRTAAEIDEDRCFDPVRTPIRLYQGAESAWRLWNHFVSDRAWSGQNFDETSTWLLTEGSFIQSIPVTLFTSRRGSATWNDPLALWRSMGGIQDPVVIMVFPTPVRAVLPEDHLIFVPSESFQNQQFAFLVDVIDDLTGLMPLRERVAIRGNEFTPRQLATMLGHRCDKCKAKCGNLRKHFFQTDQRMRCRTGSYVILDVTRTQVTAAKCANEGQAPRLHEGADHRSQMEESSFFQFQPPPRIGTHTDGEEYFWVRNTIVYQPALLLAMMEAGLLVSGHWPTFSVYLEDRPIEVRAFGFDSGELITTDAIRVRFRELFADHFATEETVSFGAIGLNNLQNRRVPIHELEAAAFRQRVPLHAKPVLLRARFPDAEAQTLTRAALLPSRSTKADVIRKADLVTLCDSRFHCNVYTEEGTLIRSEPVHITGWQCITIELTERNDNVISSRRTGQDCALASLGTGTDDEQSLMQTPNQAVFDFDHILIYAFASTDPFFADTSTQARVESYCHLWAERDGPMRNRLPIVLNRNSPATAQIAVRWSHLVPLSLIRLVPVRPVPDMGGVAVPHVLVLDRDSEQVLPVLYDYTSDDRVFTGSALVDCQRGFPEMIRLFDLLVPGHACRTQTSCLVRANGRHYVPGQIVMLYEGIFLQLDEDDLEAETTTDATSTDYGQTDSRTSTNALSSDLSLQPGPAVSDSNGTGAPGLPLAGPFFDADDDGALFIVDHDLAPEVVLEWFQAIAVQRTTFPQFDHFMVEMRAYTDISNFLGVAMVIVGSEWSEAIRTTSFVTQETHMMVYGVVRRALFDDFPVHVALDLWLVRPNLLPEEQDGSNYLFVLVDFACPVDQRAVIVITEDPEEPELDKQALRLRPQMTNLLLYIQIGKTVKCTSADFICAASHEGRALPEGAYWPVFHGMKIKVSIHEVKPACREIDRHRRIFTRDGNRLEGNRRAFHDEGDENAMMQFFSESELNEVPEDIGPRHEQARSYFGILSLHPDMDTSSDILRAYIHERKGHVSHDAFTVYVWMLQTPHPKVVHTAQRCAMLKGRSYIDSIFRLWEIVFPLRPLAVTLVHPDLQPLELRAVPIDLVVIPEDDVAQGLRVYLVDVIGMPLPRRLALFADEFSTVRAIADTAGARLICELPTTTCTIHSAAPNNRQTWSYEQIVDTDHGAGLTLWIEPKPTRTAVHALTCADATQLVQHTATVAAIEYDRYARESVQYGHMHLWLHQGDLEPYQSQHRSVGWKKPRTMASVRQLIWADRDLYQWELTPVYPFPKIEGEIQPTLIIHPVADTSRWAVFVGGESEERRVIGTIVVEASLAPFSTDFLFDQVLPRNRCRERNICTAALEDETYEFWVDIPLFAGAFVELTERSVEPEESTTCSDLTEQAEESSFTDDEEISLTQLDFRQFQFIRCHETGRPISTQMRRHGVEDMDRHWQHFEEEMFERTSWHRSQDLRQELVAMAPIAPRGTKVFLLWFDENDALAGQLNLQWEDEWSLQPGLAEARAEIRLMLWNQISPDFRYALGTAHPQPTTRQQHGRDDVYIVGQLAQDNEIAVMLVTNYINRQQDQYHIRAFKTHMYSTREIVLRNTAMTGMCEVVHCTVSSNGDQWMPGVSYPVYIAKRIDIDVVFDLAAAGCDEETQEHDVMDMGDVEYADSEVETDDAILMQQVKDGENTATPGSWENRVTNAQVQPTESNYERLYMDDGRSNKAVARWARCVANRLAWLEPLRLRPLEMQRCWDFRGVDYVRDHFARQGLTQRHFRISGWLFRDFTQRIGTPFNWGFSDRSPWYDQIAKLMQGSRFESGLMYTVIPQPPAMSLAGDKPSTLQLLTPFAFELPDHMLLVVEHRLNRLPQTAAVSCPRPCTVFGVFDILGLTRWCGARYKCMLTVKHGTCEGTFQELNRIDVPTASRGFLSVVTKERRQCTRSNSPRRIARLAKHVADIVATGDAQRHSEVYRSARRVLQHRSETRSSDETSLMQRTLPQPEEDFQSLDTPLSGEYTADVSEISSRPPPVGPQPNEDSDWLHSWQRVRGAVYEYARAVGRRQLGRNPFVHLLICRQGHTTSTGVDCPDWILDANRPVHFFSNWCQQFAFPFDVRYTRAFSSNAELYQNIPSIVLVEHLQTGHFPLVVQVVQARSAFWSMMR